MSVPGVGPVTSLTFKTAIADPQRFRSSRTVAAHFGLTPRRYQSGEMDNPGRISKAGDQLWGPTRDLRVMGYGKSTLADDWIA
jgi:transposase